MAILLLFCFRKNEESKLFKLGFDHVPSWECLYVHYETKLFLSDYVDDYKMAGRKRNIGPMWAAMKAEGLDLEPSVPLSQNVYLGCGQQEVLPDRALFDDKMESFKMICFGGPSGKVEGDPLRRNPRKSPRMNPNNLPYRWTIVQAVKRELLLNDPNLR